MSRVVPLDSAESFGLCQLLESQGLLSTTAGTVTPRKTPKSTPKQDQIRLLVDELSARRALNDEAIVGVVMRTVCV